MSFRLTCIDCSFETVVDVDVDAVFDVIEEHQSEHEDELANHLVDFERQRSVSSD